MQEINLYDLIKYYAKNWVFITTLTVLGLICGLIYNARQTPLYKSNATLLVIDSNQVSAPDVTKINNYVALFESHRVLDPVIASQHLHTSYNQLVKSVQATNEKDTEVINVSISSDNPDKSRKVLSASVTSFMKEVSALYATDNIKIVDRASNATTPYNIHKGLQLAIATVIGFLISCIALFFIYDYNSYQKMSVKKTVRKTFNNRRLYNAGVRITGRVGYVPLISNKTSHKISAKRGHIQKTVIKVNAAIHNRLKPVKANRKSVAHKKITTTKRNSKTTSKNSVAKSRP